MKMLLLGTLLLTACASQVRVGPHPCIPEMAQVEEQVIVTDEHTGKVVDCYAYPRDETAKK
jgi:hypothetical protein